MRTATSFQTSQAQRPGMTRNAILRIVFLLCLAPSGTSAAIYKWVDGQGITHYSAKAPAGQDTQQLKSRPAPSAPEYGSEQSGTKDLNEYLRLKSYREKRKQREQQEEAEKKMRAKRAHRCKIAKSRLEMLQRQGPLYRLNDNGVQEFIDDSTRESEIRSMKEAIESNC